MVPHKWYYAFYPKCACLATSVDERGASNVFTASWVCPASFEPPFVSLAVGNTRASHSNISRSREFVVCVMPAERESAARVCGSKSGRDCDKFREAGLTALPARKVKPPLIKEALACIECRVEKECEAGDHTVFVARVLEFHEFAKGKKLFHAGEGKFVGL
ncbi:MAG: flavin reductase family protein [Candidatus Norongarragalinales archaeon]